MKLLQGLMMGIEKMLAENRVVSRRA